MNPLVQLKKSALFLIPLSLLLACFGLAPMVQAQGPDTDGAIPGSNNGEGIRVLVRRTTGVWNTGTGFEALNHLTAGNQNTATGLRALFSDTNGGFNTATGVYSLFSNTSGFFNSATGAYALANNTTGNSNTANGYSALYFNTTGTENTANGFFALYHNTTGSFNTANGYHALNANTSGGSNTANGVQALLNNTTGAVNTATGGAALGSNTTGALNTATGQGALGENTTGYYNTANGVGALVNNTTGNNNTAIGFNAGDVITGDGNVCIGANVHGVAGENNTTRIRNIYGSLASARAVYVNSDDKIGTLVSSRRFKDEIKPMDKASEGILALRPVTFRYKKEIEPNGAIMFGLIAEEVEKVAPELVTRNDKGEVETVRYEAVNAMLLNEFLKERRKNQEQEATIAELKSGMQALTATVKEQAAQIQKVSAQLEMTKPAQQIALK